MEPVSAATTEKVAKLANVVRQKIKSLKQDLTSQQEAIERQVAPLKLPLTELVKEVGSKHHIKTEPAQESDMGIVKAEARKSDVNTQTEQVVSKSESESDKDLSVYIAPNKVDELLSGTESDKIYGIRFDGSKYWIGDSRIRFGKRVFKIGGKKYPMTDGLIQLMTRKSPEYYDDYDLELYKQILEQTNGHRKTYSSDKPINSNKGRKYVNIIGPLFASGRGFEREKYLSTYNVLDMLSRLELLWSSENAGNSHTSEIDSILRQLKQIGVIY